jgi:hypothetical protein
MADFEFRIKELLDKALVEESARYVSIIVKSGKRNYECSIDGCARRGYAKGLCEAHYTRTKKGKQSNLPIRNRKQLDMCVGCGKKAGYKGGWARCARCYRRARNELIKNTLIKIFGNECGKCHNLFPMECYDFHHVDMSTKEMTPARVILNRSMKEVAKELSKCVLLCANCHRSLHKNLV